MHQNEEEFDGKEYERWFAAECIPILKNQVAVVHKHLDLYMKGESIGEPNYFTYFTMWSCDDSSRHLAFTLIEKQEAPIFLHRSALFKISQQYSDASRIGECVNPEVIKEILTCYDDDSSFWIALVLIECLLLKRNRDFFTSNGIDFAEILNNLCESLGVEKRALSNDEEMFACVDELRLHLVED